MLLRGSPRRRGVDVLHSLASVGPDPTPGMPHVITLHDVTFFRRARSVASTTFGMRQVVARAARHADALIAGAPPRATRSAPSSGSTRRAFSVVPHGAGRPAGRPPRPTARGARTARPRRAAAWSCASPRSGPHKNQELLVRAAAQLPADVAIVLAGHPEPYDRELRSLAADAGRRRSA